MVKPAKKKCLNCPYYPKNKKTDAKSLLKASRLITAHYRRVKKEH